LVSSLIWFIVMIRLLESGDTSPLVCIPNNLPVLC